MSKKYLKWIGLTALMCTIGFAFLSAAPDPETATVEELLEKRTDVMGNVLLGKISYEEGKRLLKEVETDKLYSDDVENLQKYIQADIDMVTDMKVVRLEKKSHIYDKMTFTGEISWRYMGNNGGFGHRDEYQIGVTKTGGEYRLTFLEIQ